MWEKQDGDRKPTGKYEWTSLTGREKKHLLATLPDKLLMLCQRQPYVSSGKYVTTHNIHVPYHYTTDAYRILRLSTS